MFFIAVGKLSSTNKTSPYVSSIEKVYVVGEPLFFTQKLQQWMKQKVASVDEQASFFLFLTLHLGMDFEFRRVMDLWPLSVESAALASSSRAASWRRRHAAPQLPAMQTLEVPLDGANTADS